MPAKVRHADTLKTMGFSGDLAEFRRVLVEVKAERFSEWSIDELTYTRDEAAEFCKEVRSRLNAPKLTRVFILRALVGLRKKGRGGLVAVGRPER